jgi:anaerobic selenocysteine-containing dehydrogenase
VTEPTTTKRSYCKFCVANCGVLVDVTADGRVAGVRGDRDHALSRGYLCPKGRAIGRLHHHPDRLDEPLLGRGPDRRAPGWGPVLDDLAARLRAIADEHGADAVAGYGGNGGAQDGAAFATLNKLVRNLGSRNWYTALTVDCPSKGYVAELLAGSSALTAHIDDDCRLTVLIGTNPVVSHGHTTAMGDPISYHRRLAQQGQLWVLDPRRTETARLATRHVAPRPGTDHVILAHLVREVLRAGADTDYLDAHGGDLEALRAAVEPFDSGTAAARAGVDPADLRDLVTAIRAAGRLSVVTGTGASMSAAANLTEWLAWALLVVTGSFERPGGMWFNPGPGDGWKTRSFRPRGGEAQPGPPSRPELPRRWGQMPCAALADDILAGNVKALVVLGGNPLASFPDPDRVREALLRLDVLAVCDIVANPMTELGTHVLPAAADLERADAQSGVISTKPAVFAQWAPAALPIGADRRKGWWIFSELGDRLGVEPLVPVEARGSDEDVLHALNGFDPHHPDMRWGEVQDYRPSLGWVADRVLPDGRWRLAPTPLLDQLRADVDAPAELVLVPRRQLRHMNSALLDGGGQGAKVDEPVLQMSRPDAETRGIADGDLVEVRSAYGTLQALAAVGDEVRPCVVCLPHGFVSANVNALTSLAEGVDPLTGMVLLSGVPVSVAQVGATPRANAQR